MTKILTEIYNPEGMRKKKLRVEGNKILVKKGKQGRGRADYRAEFDKNCLITYRKGVWPLKILSQKLMLIDGADRCIKMHYSAETAGVEMPVWDRETEDKAAEANVVKNFGSIATKISVPTPFYILMLMVFAISFATMLVASGRLKI